MGMKINRRLPFLAAWLAVLAFALNGAALAAGPVSAGAKMGKAVQGSFNKVQLNGRAAKKPAQRRAKPAKSKKGQSSKGKNSYKSWQRSHSWHAGLPPDYGKAVRLDLAVNGRPGKDGLDSGVCRSGWRQAKVFGVFS
jgi:hypothetical protein